jgi:hypothetical protein
MATGEDDLADVEPQWYQGLLEEDCLVVMDLLRHYPQLLKVGWEGEPSRWVEGRQGREGTGRKEGPWTGRTALYVGASRGCVELVMQVLGLCNLDGFSEVSATYQRSLLDAPPYSPSEDTLAHLNANLQNQMNDIDCGNLLLAKDGESGLDALAVAVLHNNAEITCLLKYLAAKVQFRNHYNY